MNSVIISALTGTALDEIKNMLVKAGESVLTEYKNAKELKKIFENLGDFYANYEKSEEAIFDDLKIVLAKENMENIAKNLKNEDGYDIDTKLMAELKKLMRKYDIPYEYAEAYSKGIVIAFINQLRRVEPEKYQQYFMQNWKKENEDSFAEICSRIEKMSSEIDTYTRKKLDIKSSGDMDLSLKKKTMNPSIGIDFFVIDDDIFRGEFDKKRFQNRVYVRGSCREESIYCVLNELWRLNEKRPIFVVKSLESWEKLGSQIEDIIMCEDDQSFLGGEYTIRISM